MILSDNDIKEYIAAGKIKIDPLPDFESCLGPCSLDLRLGNNFKMFRPSNYNFIDVKNNYNGELMEEVIVGDDMPFIIQPREFVIAVTKETNTLTPDLMGRLDGRSSLGRLGLVVHSTAARFDPGWTGKAVMEFGNLGIRPIILYAGMRICAMTFETLSSPAGVPYLSQKDHKYAGQSGAVASKIAEEENISKK